MRIDDLFVSNDRTGKPAYATVTLRSSHEAQAMLGEGEQEILHKGVRWKVKPIAIGSEPNVVCCRVQNV